MTKNNKLNNQEELFARDCKLINLKYEYDGYTGTEKWAIITELMKENCGINTRILSADTLHLSCCLWHREK